MSEPQDDEAHTSSPTIKSPPPDRQRQVGIIKLAAVQIKTEASTVYEKTDGIQCYDTMLESSKSQTQVGRWTLSNLTKFNKNLVSKPYHSLRNKNNHLLYSDICNHRCLLIRSNTCNITNNMYLLSDIAYRHVDLLINYFNVLLWLNSYLKI